MGENTHANYRGVIVYTPSGLWFVHREVFDLRSAEDDVCVGLLNWGDELFRGSKQGEGVSPRPVNKEKEPRRNDGKFHMAHCVLGQRTMVIGIRIGFIIIGDIGWLLTV